MSGTVKKRFTIGLDIADSGANREFTVVEGDSGNQLSILITDGGDPVDLTGCRVVAVFSRSDGTSCQDSGIENGGVTLCGALNNQVDIDLFASSVAPGMVECELQIYSDIDLSTLVTTAKFNFACRRAIMGEDTVTALPQYPMLSNLIERVETLEASASEAADNANSAAELCHDALDGSISTWRIIYYAKEE